MKKKTCLSATSLIEGFISIAILFNGEKICASDATNNDKNLYTIPPETLSQKVEKIADQAGLMEARLLQLIPESWAAPFMKDFLYQTKDLPGVTHPEEINNDVIENIILFLNEIKTFAKNIKEVHRLSATGRAKSELIQKINDFLAYDSSYEGDKEKNSKYIEQLKENINIINTKLEDLEQCATRLVELYSGILDFK